MIKCENLSAGYGEENVISGINWELKEGKLTAILGANGSGKSTLLKSIMGQTLIREGCVFLKGKPMKQYKRREIAKCLAYMPQSRNDANISVFKMVLHGRFPHLSYPRHYTKKDEEIVINALERMKISGLCEKPVSELSGGEKQRAYLAMALAGSAPVLLLDEPAAYLDLSAQIELMEMLKQLTEEGKTIAVILHDINYALKYAQEIVLMEKGRQKQCGTPKEILESGVLEEVFNVNIHVLEDKSGRAYCFLAKER